MLTSVIPQLRHMNYGNIYAPLLSELLLKGLTKSSNIIKTPDRGNEINVNYIFPPISSLAFRDTEMIAL